MTAADRQKAYRARKKAAGIVVRQINQTAIEDARLNAEEREQFHNALRDRAYLRSEVDRLRTDNDRLKVELAKEAQFHSITTKELIVTRDALQALKKVRPAP